MIRSVFSIVVLVLIGQLCAAEIVLQTSKTKDLTELYEAAIDVLMTCHGDPGSAVGILGDSDGSVLNALRSKYFVPVVLIDDKFEPTIDSSRHHPLRSFVIACNSPKESVLYLNKLVNSVWANQFANYIFIHRTFNKDGSQCSASPVNMLVRALFGLINGQFVCYDAESRIWIYEYNQFTRHAPSVWTFMVSIKFPDIATPTSIFARIYRKGGQSCEALNFPKTIDIGGWPLQFRAFSEFDVFDNQDPRIQKYLKSLPNNARKAFEARLRQKQWFVETVTRVLNATAVIVKGNKQYYGKSRVCIMGIYLWPTYLETFTLHTKILTKYFVLPLSEMRMFAVTMHTGHKSQLEKILTVIDGHSRIGMCIVYLITFLFFKIFIRQAVMPALLNLVRLTCNTGLPNLPNDLASSIYLACLLMFVVTLQGIYTGNLATLLTTTIAHRNVQTKQDIPYLGYTVYTPKYTNDKLVADPMLDGHVIEIGPEEKCFDFLMGEPLVACIVDEQGYLEYMRTNLTFHISRDPILTTSALYFLTHANPLGPRLRSILRRLVEHGLWYTDPVIEKLRLLYLNDEEVMKNVERRVMNLNDLCFAFVILGVGLLCACICFIGEIVVCEIRSKMTKRRNRVRARLAWGVKKNYFLSFRSLNFRFNPRRLFSRRR